MNKTSRHYACDVADLASIPMKHLEVAGVDLLVSRVDRRFFATAARCTHKGVSLAEGELEGTTLTCLAHGATFNIETGAATLPAATPLPTYPVEEADGKLYVLI